MNRRDLLKAGATAAAIPALGLAQNPWKPALLTTGQNETVIVLTDLIIPETDTPGAKAANVNRYIDRLLKDGPAGERARFLSGLRWLDNFSKKKHGTPFTRLNRKEQVQILELLQSETTPSMADGNRFFRLVKSLTSRVYYHMEIGHRELNKDGVPGGFGCKHPRHG